MNWLNKLERKFGRYAVPNLIVYLIGAYSVGFVLNMVAPNILGFLNFQPYYILHGQIWRLITWILMPTDSNIIFLLIMMMFYYQLGTALERAWGTFRFNAYIIGGILLTEVGSLLAYGLIYLFMGGNFLGGAVAALAFAYDMPLVLIPVGIVYICETLSDILQVGYFKLTHGKRIFKMAPLHHHFEMCGWKETKIVAVFTTVSVIFCALAYLGVMNRFAY